MNFARPMLHTPTTDERIADHAYDCAMTLDIPYTPDRGATERLDEFDQCMSS